MDSRRLIALVHAKPALWDRTHHLRSNKYIIEKYWREISSALREDEYKVRKKWRYLRDQFSVELGKCLTVTIAGDKTSVKCPKWHHFKSLLFLKDQVKPRTTIPLDKAAAPAELHFKDASDSRSSPDEFNCDDGRASPKNEDDPNDDLPLSFEATPQKRNPVKKTRKPIKITRMEAKLRYLLARAKSKQQHTTCDDDEHMYFFKSLLPHVKNIPKNRLLSFRARIHEVVEEFVYGMRSRSESARSSISNFSNHSPIRAHTSRSDPLACRTRDGVRDPAVVKDEDFD